MSYYTNITNARKDLYKLAEMALENGTEININTKKGNVMMIAEEEYRGLLETIHLSANESLKKSLIKGRDTDFEDTLSEDDVEW